MKNFKKYFSLVFILSIIITSFVGFNKAVAVDTCVGTPTVTYGGKVYNTVQIGTQCWLKENLNVGTMVGGVANQLNNNILEKYCYNNLESNCTDRGGLYQWAEAVQYKNNATNTINWSPVPTGNVQGICPAGWHIPSSTEFGTLGTYLGGQGAAGGKIKETGFLHFNSPNVFATNSSGFTAIPNGLRWASGLFYYMNLDSNLWTTTSGQNPATDIYYSGASYGSSVMNNSQFYKNTGLSVRCLKDDSNSLTASVSISASANPVTSGTSVTFTAIPTNGGTVPTYQWKNNGTSISGATNVTYSYVPVNSDVITVVMTSNLAGVTGSPTTSNAITMVVNSGVSCPGTPTVSYGGKTYDTVQIGTQCWLKQNLNIGNKITGTQSQTNNNVVEKYCYDNLDTNCDVYGGLYDWAEAVQYKNNATNTTNWSPVPTGDVQGMCPTGWHIPTNTEFGTLFTSLGGQSVAGGKIKEAGLNHFSYPNTGATNSSGFTALPGGTRWSDSTFHSLNQSANIWTITTGANPATDVYYNGAKYSIIGATSGQFYKTQSSSVRCLKNSGTTAPGPVLGFNDVFKGTVTSDSEVNLSWIAPSNNGGSPITDYTIEYKLTSNSSWTVFPHSPSTGTSMIITNLTLSDSSNYDFRVKAVNAIGSGPYSPTFTTSSLPSRVTGVIASQGSGQINLTWPAPNNGGSSITKYAVRYKLTSNPTWTGSTIVNTTTTSAVITGLTNGVSYDIKVRAWNIRGGGLFSTSVSQSPVAFSGNSLTANALSAQQIKPGPDQKTVELGLLTKSFTLGKKHSEVKKLQKFLNESGYVVKNEGAGSNGNETEYFGQATKEALVKFQKDNKINPTSGNFGPMTRSVVNNILGNR